MVFNCVLGGVSVCGICVLGGVLVCSVWLCVRWCSVVH